MTSPTHFGALLRFKVYAELKAESNRTYAGYLWWVFEPLLFYGRILLCLWCAFLDAIRKIFVPFLLVGVHYLALDTVRA